MRGREEREFVEKYLPFVYSIAKKWYTSFRVISSVVDFEDLVQEVWVGLLVARRRFDSERFKNKFLTYAWYAVRSRLVDVLKKEEREFAARVRIAEVVRKTYYRNRKRGGEAQWKDEFGLEDREVREVI